MQFKDIVSFFTALKTKLDESKLLLSTSITVSDQFDYNSVDLSALCESVEFITFTQNHKLSSNGLDEASNVLQINNIEQEIERLIGSGVSPTKIVLGLNFAGYGFTTTIVNNDEDAKFDRIYRYNEVCGLQLTDPRKWKTIRNEPSLSMVMSKEENKVILIESSRSIANKVRFAIKRGLAGIAPIYIAFDELYGLKKIDRNIFEDFVPYDGVDLNIPVRSDRKFPLLNTINEAIDVTLDELNQEAELSVTPRSTTTTTTQRVTTTKATTITPEITTSDYLATTLSPEQTLEIVTDKDKKVICQVYLTSFTMANEVDWNLCTHVISVEKAVEGMMMIYWR